MSGRTADHAHDDFASEPVRGLPERLPAGEDMLWQGAPDWRRLAWDAYYLKPVLAWFGVLAVWLGVDKAMNGVGPLVIAQDTLALLPFALVPMAVLVFIAWLSARSTVYTITTKRVVMRFGVAYQIAFNLPFSRIEGASLRPRGRDLGDISLKLQPGNRVGYIHFWPHVRPWTLNQPQPTLRAVPEARTVAATLTRAFLAANPVAARHDPGEAAKPGHASLPKAIPQPAGLRA
jgi:hypothetical protein